MERWPHTLHHGCDHPRKMENLTWEDTRKWFGYSCGQFILVLFFSHQSDHQWYLLHLFSCLPSLPTCLANDSAESNPNPTSGARWPSAQQTWLNRLDWQERRIWWNKIWSESILVAGRCTLFCPADCPATHWLQLSLPSPHYCPIAHWSREGIAMILQNPGKLSWEAWLKRILGAVEKSENTISRLRSICTQGSSWRSFSFSLCLST